MLLTCALFVVDRLSSQMGIIRTIYLKSIVRPIRFDADALSGADDGPRRFHLGRRDGRRGLVTFGSQYIFYAVAALSLVNLAVAIIVKDPRKTQALS